MNWIRRDFVETSLNSAYAWVNREVYALRNATIIKWIEIRVSNASGFYFTLLARNSVIIARK